MTTGRRGSVICALLVVVRLAYAQESPSDTSSSPIAGDLSAFWHDAGVIFTAPARFDASEWGMAGIVAGGTALTFTADNSVRSFARRNVSEGADDVSEVGRQYGENLNILLLSGGVYAGGLAFRSEHVRTTGRMMLEAALFAGVTTTLVKSIFGRSRPYLEEGPYRFRFFEIDNDYLSLPSGHSTLAFAVSSVLATRMENTYASIALYSLAALTACSRIYSDEHWFSDTLLGAAIGTTVGWTIAKPRREGGTETSFRIFPTPGGLRLVVML